MNNVSESRKLAEVTSMMSRALGVDITQKTRLEEAVQARYAIIVFYDPKYGFDSANGIDRKLMARKLGLNRTSIYHAYRTHDNKMRLNNEQSKMYRAFLKMVIDFDKGKYKGLEPLSEDEPEVGMLDHGYSRTMLKRKIEQYNNLLSKYDDLMRSYKKLEARLKKIGIFDHDESPVIKPYIPPIEIKKDHGKLKKMHIDNFTGKSGITHY